jgi:HNH endonuclease
MAQGRAKISRDAAYRSYLDRMVERDKGIKAERPRPASDVIIIKADGSVETASAYTAADVARITHDRVPLTLDERVAILRRDGYRCRYCGRKRGPWHVDHVQPVILGGTNDPDNLVAACRACNLKKGIQTWEPLPPFRA